MKLDFKKDSKMLLLALLSGIIEGIAHASFVVPAGLFPGGFSGISRLSSQILSTFFSISIPYSYIYFSLNAIAAIIVFRYIGKKFTIFSLIQVFTCSVMITTFKPRMKKILLPLISKENAASPEKSSTESIRPSVK